MTNGNRVSVESRDDPSIGYTSLLVGVVIMLVVVLSLAAYTLYNTHLSNLPRFNPPS